MNYNLTPIQAIKRKCLECSNGQYHEIKGCIVNACPLYPFRTGEKHIRKEDNTEQITLDCFDFE